jgi:hypothetical protein
MISKKNGFLTFMFSLLPGAGEMYMGFMKRGASLMSFFFFILFLGSWLNIGPMLFILPILWFYSFFDTHNLRAMPDDEFYALEDRFILFPQLLDGTILPKPSKFRNIIAIALIVFGFSILWNNTFNLFDYILPSYMNDIFRSFGDYIPQFLIGLAIILFGIYLIRGKKIELDQTQSSDLFDDIEDVKENDNVDHNVNFKVDDKMGYKEDDKIGYKEDDNK